MSITTELEDKDTRRAYQANIAMAFKDSFYSYKKNNNKKNVNREDVHIIANTAANYFLDLLMNKIKR